MTNAQKLMKIRLIDLASRVDKLSPTERDEARREISSIADYAAFIAGYLDGRYNAVAEDEGHERATKKANRTRKSVRRIFGYHTTPAISI